MKLTNAKFPVSDASTDRQNIKAIGVQNSRVMIVHLVLPLTNNLCRCFKARIIVRAIVVIQTAGIHNTIKPNKAPVPPG